MQKNIFLLACLVFNMIVTQTGYAGVSPQPAKCPSASAIAAFGIEEVLDSLCQGSWGGIVRANQYDTSDTWTFFINKDAICGIPAKDASEAREKILASLSSLKYFSGPEHVSESMTEDAWMCAYTNAQDYIAIAVTPPMKTNRFIKR